MRMPRGPRPVRTTVTWTSVTPLTPGRPGVGLHGGHGHLAGRRIPFVAVAFPSEGIAFGDVGPVGALPVHPEVGKVDLRPDDWALIAEIDQSAKNPIRRKVSGDLEADGRHRRHPPIMAPTMERAKIITRITVAITSPVVMPRGCRPG